MSAPSVRASLQLPDSGQISSWQGEHVRSRVLTHTRPALPPEPSPVKPTDVHNPSYFHRVVDCQWACPAHTNVPEYIRLIAQGRYSDAYILNRESNVFPGILGRTCDRPCEPACRRERVEVGEHRALCGLAVGRGLSDHVGRRTPGRARPRRRPIRSRSSTRRAETPSRPGAGPSAGWSPASRARGRDSRSAVRCARP